MDSRQIDTAVDAAGNVQEGQLSHAVNGKLIALYDAIANTAGVTREIAVAETGYFVHALVVAMIQNAQPAWQSIETAPKDGVRVVLAYLNVERSALVCWVPHLGGWQEPGIGLVTPTHWMPLPSPPVGCVSVSNERSESSASLPSAAP